VAADIAIAKMSLIVVPISTPGIAGGEEGVFYSDDRRAILDLGVSTEPSEPVLLNISVGELNQGII